MIFRKSLAAALLLAASSLAMAQYIWIDDKGIKQLSDRPPPPNVPDQRILKAPGKPLFNPYAPVEAEAGAEAPASKPATTLAQRNADYKQRKLEAAEAAGRAADDARRKAEQAANCDAARQNQQALDQGLRLNSFDQSGERTIMNDDQREDLRKKTQKVLADCK